MRKLKQASMMLAVLALAAQGIGNAGIVLAKTRVRIASQVIVKQRPNIILVVADDLGSSDLRSYGSDFHRTPNLDGLAARGIKFTNAYAASPVCSPSRASLLTGKHPARLHLTDWLPGREDSATQKLLRPTIRRELPRNEITIAEALKSAGYATANIGKWHLGGEGFAPEDQGFDSNIAGDHRGTPVSYFYPYVRGDETTPGLVQGRAGEYLTDRLTDEAEKFIEANKAKPFFLYLPHYAVHIPMRAKPEVIAEYREAVRPGLIHSNPIYAAMIESLDDSVGRIVDKLGSLALLDNTIIIFTSDNGGLTAKEGADTPATSNAPLRDGKGFLYEGGIRVPLIVYWRGRIEPGVSIVPVGGADLFPTVLEVAGVEPSKNIDGSSLVPLFARANSLRRAALYWHYPHYSNQGGNPGGAIRAGDYKLIEFFEDSRHELYDLARDPGETVNLSTKMPAKARSLRSELRRWRARIGAQMMTPNPAYRVGS